MKLLPTAALVACCAGCGGSSNRAEPPADATTARRDEPPIALDPDTPIPYPDALVGRGIGGTVVLRLFVDSAGTAVPESTAVQESSGTVALDSAAVSGVARMRFAPGIRNGSPTAMRFLQPVTFTAPAASRGTPRS